MDVSEEDLSSGQDGKFLSSSEPKEFPPTKSFAELRSGAIDGKFIPSGTNRISYLISVAKERKAGNDDKPDNLDEKLLSFIGI